LKTANDRADTAEKEAAKVADAEARATTAETTLNTFKAEAALNAAVLANNVDAKHVPLLLKAHKADITFNEKGEPQLDGKSIEAWGKDYFAKDGLGYVRPSENDGGGATGGTTAVNTSYAGKAFNLGEYSALKKTDAAAAAAWATESGNGYLNSIN
jgi:hypothetical protein